jgi:DNA-binding transcriptional LysR family regulator
MERVCDLNDMRLFASVVDHGGFNAAAAALGMQASRLSRHIAALESTLGVRLLNRTTRRISVTDIGQIFYHHCAALVAEAQAAADAVDRTLSTPQGLVRISCPLALLQSGVSAIVANYLEANPQVRIAVDATNRRVDVVEEGIDLALRVRQPPLEDSDLVVRILRTSESVLVASPRLFEHYRRPASIEEVARLPTLAMSRSGGKYTWIVIGPDAMPVAVSHQPRLATDDMPTLRLAALQGLGATLLPKQLVQADIEAGLLEQLLPEVASPNHIVHAVFPSRRGMVPAVRGLLDALVEGCKSTGFLA